jgi:hypothetical protein
MHAEAAVSSSGCWVANWTRVWADLSYEYAEHRCCGKLYMHIWIDLNSWRTALMLRRMLWNWKQVSKLLTKLHGHVWLIVTSTLTLTLLGAKPRGPRKLSSESYRPKQRLGLNISPRYKYSCWILGSSVAVFIVAGGVSVLEIRISYASSISGGQLLQHAQRG